MKKIKSPLPIDGTHVRTIAELQDHFSTEILDLYKNGKLLRWLQMHGHTSHAEAVQRLFPSEPDTELLKLLCGIFEVEVDADTIQELASYPSGAGVKIDPEQINYKQLYEELLAKTNSSTKKARGEHWFGNEFVSAQMPISEIERIHKSLTGEDIVLVPISFSFHEAKLTSLANQKIGDFLGEKGISIIFEKNVGDFIVTHPICGEKNLDFMIIEKIKGMELDYYDNGYRKIKLSPRIGCAYIGAGILYKKVYNINWYEQYQTIAYLRIDV